MKPTGAARSSVCKGTLTKVLVRTKILFQWATNFLLLFSMFFYRLYFCEIDKKNNIIKYIWTALSYSTKPRYLYRRPLRFCLALLPWVWLLTSSTNKSCTYVLMLYWYNSSLTLSPTRYTNVCLNVTKWSTNYIWILDFYVTILKLFNSWCSKVTDKKSSYFSV